MMSSNPRFVSGIMFPVVFGSALRANTCVLRAAFEHVPKKVILFGQFHIVLFDMKTPKVSSERLGRVNLNYHPAPSQGDRLVLRA